MKKYLFILSLLIIASMVLTACGGAAATEPPAAIEAPAETAASLTGTTWKLTTYGRVDSPEPAVAEEGFITFSTNGTLTGLGACDQFEGNYEVKGNQIVLSPLTWGVGGHNYCPEPQMSQESGVYEVLQGTIDFKIKGNTLTITNTDMDQVLVFEKS